MTTMKSIDAAPNSWLSQASQQTTSFGGSPPEVRADWRHELCNTNETPNSIKSQENEMAFVNEYVSTEDAKKYDLDGIRTRLGHRPYPQYRWTIDHERDVFLMWIVRGRESFAAHQTFLFWWKGTPLVVRLLSATTDTQGMVTSTWQFQRFDELPPGLAGKKEELLGVLKEALVEYKVSGIGSLVENHTAVFKF